MNVAVAFLLLNYLLKELSALHNPFSTEYIGQIYKSKYSEMKRQTVVTINNNENSNFSINIGKKEIGRFPLTGRNDNIKVKIFPNVYNPQLIYVKKIIQLKVLCEFSYPITVVARYDKYQCSLSYKDKSGQQHSIGKCTLTLQYKSSVCLVSGPVDTEKVSHHHQVVILATVHHCNSACVRNNDLSWKSVVNTSVTFPFVSREQLIWMTAFVKPSENIAVLIGVPKNPIIRATLFELPIKLRRHEGNDKIVSLQLQIIYNKQVSLEDVIPSKCFSIDPKSFEDTESIMAEVEVRRNELGQCPNEDRDNLFILQMISREESKQLSMNITVEFIGDTNITVGKKSEKFTITIPIFKGGNTIVPVTNNPIILPNLKKLNNPYEIQASDLKVYYIYDETVVTDVSTRVHCRPFNSSRLICPSNMRQLIPVLISPENLEDVQWSLELMVDGLFFVLTVDPMIRPDDQWFVSFPDSVLNSISGWQAIRRSKDASLLTDTKCEPIYQVATIQIYKKMYFHDRETNKSLEMMMDLSDNITLRNIRLSNGLAEIYKSDGSLVIQGISSGNLIVELISEDNSTLLKTFMTVYSAPVTVTDVDVSCISDIQVINKLLLSSSVLVVGDLQFQFGNLNGSRDCFFIIDLIFSDKTRTNLISFPRDQFSLRFLTNTKIILMPDPRDMWYNYDRFNKEDSFQVELLESNFCEGPKTIVKKFVQLNVLKKPISKSTNVTIKPITTNLSIAIESSIRTTMSSIVSTTKDSNNTGSLKGITYVLIIIVTVALVIIIVNILVRYYKNKKSRAYRSCRRKSLNVTDMNNMNDKDYPPLLPPPGPQVQLSDSTNVTISSPHSFWCLDPKKAKRPNGSNPFVRQSSLPVKGCSSRNFNEIAPCPPLRWANKMIPNCPIDNSYTSQDGLNSAMTQDMLSCSPMTWSVTHMDVEESSGVGSLNTNIDDLIKDPYGSRERFHKLSELPCSHSGRKENIYEMV